MPGTYRQIEVAAGLIRRDGRFLAAKRPDGAPFAGFWELPGGKLEAGEKPEDAIRRELGEELGISVTACRELAQKEHVYAESCLRVKIHFLEICEYAGEPQPLEQQELRWLLPAEARRLCFLTADADFLASL